MDQEMCTTTIAGHHLQAEEGRPTKAISVDENFSVLHLV